MPYISPAYNPDPQRKPEYPCAVDWTHPLSRGLVGCWVMNEGGGQTNPTSVGIPLEIKNSATWDNIYNIYGIRSDANGEGVEAIAPESLKLQPPLTLVWNGFSLAAPTQYGHYGGISYDNANSNPYLSYAIQGQSFYEIWMNDGSTYKYVTSSVIANRVGPMHLVAVIKNATQDFYYDGQFNTQGTNTINTIAYSATSTIAVGNYTGVSRTSNSITQQMLIYNRALTASEIQQLYIEPYGFILPC